MPPLHLMFKTVSTCNLECGYCYYSQPLAGRQRSWRIEPELLQKFIPYYMDYVADSHQANLSWQGGEPTLAGIDYFREIVNLEARYAVPPTIISNAIQTNGLLIDDEWAEFFSAFKFLVGISLDGPESMHDLERRDRTGHGSFKRVMAHIDLLRKHNVDLNVLCVIGQHNISRVSELMQFFHQERLDYLQFMPAMAFQATNPMNPPSYLVTAEQYGNFLINLFNQWYQTGVPIVSIRIFNNLLQNILGKNNDSCIYSESCDMSLVVDQKGDVYPCDFYIHPLWKLGNIRETSLEGLVGNPIRTVFLQQKQAFSSECQNCKWVSICRGECPRNKLHRENLSDSNYFCTSYKLLLDHAYTRLTVLGKRLSKYQLYMNNTVNLSASELQPDTNCPCGSGALYKDCCGDPVLASSYLFQD